MNARTLYCFCWGCVVRAIVLSHRTCNKCPSWLRNRYLIMSDPKTSKSTETEAPQFKILLRDYSQPMVDAWKDPQAFGEEAFKDTILITHGDIFEGAPAADAIVSPANSFGFMDGGIDMVYSRHFGWQMQERLQKLLRSDHDGELIVGEAGIIPAYEPDKDLSKLDLSPTQNEGKPIRYLISAPTMRIPTNVNKTVNAYLAFRAILRAVKAHNTSNPSDPITSILCPGLGTAVGRMPFLKCAIQMRKAYDVVINHSVLAINHPQDLSDCCTHHVEMTRYGNESGTQFPPRATPGELFVS